MLHEEAAMPAVEFVLPALLALTACATVNVGREFDLQRFRGRAGQGEER